jgi:hypothetical protein
MKKELTFEVMELIQSNDTFGTRGSSLWAIMTPSYAGQAHIPHVAANFIRSYIAVHFRLQWGIDIRPKLISRVDANEGRREHLYKMLGHNFPHLKSHQLLYGGLFLDLGVAATPIWIAVRRVK